MCSSAGGFAGEDKDSNCVPVGGWAVFPAVGESSLVYFGTPFSTSLLWVRAESATTGFCCLAGDESAVGGEFRKHPNPGFVSLVSFCNPSFISFSGLGDGPAVAAGSCCSSGEETPVGAQF